MNFSELVRLHGTPLIASLPANDIELARAALEGGAQALKVHINVGHRASGNHFGTLAEEQERLAAIRALSDCPMGIVCGGSLDIAETEVTGALALGFDLVSMYAHHLPARWLRFRQAEYMAAPDYTYSLEAIGHLSRSGIDMVEASVIHPDGYGQPLTSADLGLYRGICLASAAPVVLPSQRRLVPEDVPYLRQAGFAAIMIGAMVTGKTPAGMAETCAQFRRALEG